MRRSQNVRMLQIRLLQADPCAVNSFAVFKLKAYFTSSSASLSICSLLSSERADVILTVVSA